jgi:hypothetical protein
MFPTTRGVTNEVFKGHIRGGGKSYIYEWTKRIFNVSYIIQFSHAFLHNSDRD